MQLLGGLTPQQFLRDYWQKKPLLIRQAVPDFISPISPDELAGLACEEDIESRLIQEKDGPTPWHLEYGPFKESRFSELPRTHWTLLVQKANQLLPDLANLLEQFSFIPNWRIDDVMISYAPLDGTVGPHVDQYDVFLLQGSGQRRWQINLEDSIEIPLVEGTQLKILSTFEAGQEWVLETGDMLYLPPNVAHYGVAMDDCMTFSVGFRAPTYAELVTGWIDDQASTLSESLRYSDPDLIEQLHAGEINPQALDRIRQIIRQQYVNDNDIDRWFGCFITEPPSHQVLHETDSEYSNERVISVLQNSGELWRSEYSRFAFIEHPDTTWLYVDGQEHALSKQLTGFAALLCDQRRYTEAELENYLADKKALDLCTLLLNHQALEFPVSND